MKEALRYLQNFAFVQIALTLSDLNRGIYRFLKDTEPEWLKDTGAGFILRPLEVHEVPAYA